MPVLAEEWEEAVGLVAIMVEEGDMAEEQDLGLVVPACVKIADMKCPIKGECHVIH
ncbi:hypothetical protein [Caldanaerobacter subterraneus]|uniref:hypothetical protein n=1 Tax=Caldanaerobacter subterraneus TaxID=911092 RepID=UPI0003FBFD0A|nr:hypothetical protein [Caldanaerobacter subterraneus]